MSTTAVGGVVLKLGEIDRETRRRCARVLGQIIAARVLAEMSRSGNDPAPVRR